MGLRSLFRKAFIGGKWFVAYKYDNQESFQLVPVENDKWIADPFLIEENGETYLFVEYYLEKERKACLAYYKFENNLPVFGSIIIKEPYHLSYPCFFEMNGKKYILPESSAGNVLSLYECDRFPDRWHKKVDLITGQKVVDTTVYKDKNNVVHLFSYKKQSGKFYLQHYILNDDFSLDFIGDIQYDKNIGRPAGSFFFKDGNLFRPAQNCKDAYGKSLLFYKISIDDKNYSEEISEEIKIDSIKIHGKFNRVHTFNCAGNLEVVDLFKEKFDLFRSIKIFIRSHRSK